MKRVLPFSTSTPLSPSFFPKTLLLSFFHIHRILSKKKNLNTCSKESAQNIINPFTALITESVVNFQPRLHVLRRRVLRRVKERESARKRNRRGKPLGPREKKKKEKRSRIVPNSPFCLRRKRRIAFVSPISERSRRLFIFFWKEGSFSSKSAGNVRSSHGTLWKNARFALTTIGGGWSVPPPLNPGIPRRRYC